MADTQVLGTCVFGRAGSSPASRTLVFKYKLPNSKLELNYGQEITSQNQKRSR